MNETAIADHGMVGDLQTAALITTDGTAYRSKQMYHPDTAVLITRFFTADGVGEIVDFMPPLDERATDNHRLVRMLRACVGGCGSRSWWRPASTTAG
jgi:hypothetical protein